MIGVAWFVAVVVLGIAIWRWHVSDKRYEEEFKIRHGKKDSE